MADKDPHLAETDSLDEWIAGALPYESGVFFRPGQNEPANPAPGLEAGKVIGDFRLIAMIGQGGMGQVWEAEQLSLSGRRVAVKFLRPERVTGKQLAFFEREARAGGRLTHPGIVMVYGSGETDGHAWIAMERVPGAWTLRDMLDEAAREEELPPQYDDQVARFIVLLAQAMHSAHQCGVIHRDLKPRNILITPSNRPKITDFGLARIVGEDALSVTGDFAGTYYYVSPEQVAANRMGIDHRTDIFSLGVLMYEMLSLVRPFQGDTSHQVAHQIIAKEPPDLRSIRSRIPHELAVITGKALEKDRDRRYATMAELADDLERFLANVPILAQPPTTYQRVAKWCKRNPGKSLTLGVASVAFLLISILGLRIADQNNDLAMQKADIEEQRRAALQLAEDHKRTKEEILRLSYSLDLEELLEQAEAFEPAHPDQIPAMRTWIAEARGLAGQLPTLREHRDEKRAEALPWSAAEQVSDRETHPDYEEFVQVRDELGAKQAALAVREGKQPLNIAELDWERQSDDYRSLSARGWALVRPERTQFGMEPLGRQLSQRAAELAPASEKAVYVKNAAWAHLALGDDDGALEVSYRALEDADPAELSALEANMERVEQEVSARSSVEGLATARAEVARLEERLRELESRVSKRRTWSFRDLSGSKSHDRWWHLKLDQLVTDLEEFSESEASPLAARARSSDFGWSVPLRLAAAERLRDGFAEGGEFHERWQAALPALRESQPGVSLGIQMGLVPIGRDPKSGLWEFWHVLSGCEPMRTNMGKLIVEEDTGIVLVLIPGGRFLMGAQRHHPRDPNYWEAAGAGVGPVHQVELSSFFLSKYEMTQGQWQRLAGRNPSLYDENSQSSAYQHDLTHPVEQVSWADCVRLLPLLGLRLPSEAQWEYGCRGGTASLWWTGEERESLVDEWAINIADKSVVRAGLNWLQVQAWPELDDWYVFHAPVDKYSANGFGLHNVHGNVWEWCADAYDERFYDRSSQLDPLNSDYSTSSRVARGGSFDNTAEVAASPCRGQFPESSAVNFIGLRPARRLESSVE